MTAPKPSIFIRSSLQSGLVTREQIDDAVARVRATGGLDALPAVAIGDDRLADTLIEMGLLTPYQCQQLQAGRKKLNLGPYLITDWLGQGGMGQVFVAVHQMMDRQVAIKVLPIEKSTTESIASFTREIQTQAKLDHRNLVRAYDAGHDGNVYFLVTEYVPGTDLRRLVRSQGRLTMSQSASIISQAATGLGYAHEQGLIHRDVKPGNVLVTPESLVKVSDLGLAGFLHEGANDPRAGKIVGTADYLAPEKIKNPHFVSSVSDIYALGCTLYYAVTGKVPFPGGSTRDKARRHCEETPWHPRQFNPEVSDEFVDLIADMMEKTPERRIPTAADVVSRLASWVTPNANLPQLSQTAPRWQAPPVPTPGRDETISEDLSDDLSSDASPMPPTSALHETPPAIDGQLEFDGDVDLGKSEQRNRPSPVEPQDPRRAVLVALSWSIPLAMLAGAALTYLFLTYL